MKYNVKKSLPSRNFYYSFDEKKPKFRLSSIFFSTQLEVELFFFLKKVKS